MHRRSSDGVSQQLAAEWTINTFIHVVQELCIFIVLTCVNIEHAVLFTCRGHWVGLVLSWIMQQPCVSNLDRGNMRTNCPLSWHINLHFTNFQSDNDKARTSWVVWDVHLEPGCPSGGSPSFYQSHWLPGWKPRPRRSCLVGPTLAPQTGGWSKYPAAAWLQTQPARAEIQQEERALLNSNFEQLCFLR